MERLSVGVTPQVRQYLERLLATGLYGTSVTDVAERLISEGVLGAIQNETIKRLSSKEFGK